MMQIFRFNNNIKKFICEIISKQKSKNKIIII